MLVSDDDEVYVLFNSTYSSPFPDKSPLIPDGVYPTQLTQATKMEKQPAEVYSCLAGPSAIPNGSTVWYSTSARRQVAIIVKGLSVSDVSRSYTILPLNTKTTIKVSASSLTPIVPGPADIPASPADMDATLMTSWLSPEDIAQLWLGSIDDTVNEVSRLAFYWPIGSAMPPSHASIA